METSDIKETLTPNPTISSPIQKCYKCDGSKVPEDTEISEKLKYLSSWTTARANFFLKDKYTVILRSS